MPPDAATGSRRESGSTGLVEKATELGVDRLVPIVTERSVVDPGGRSSTGLRRVIVEAASSAARNRLMALERPWPWSLWMAEPLGRHAPG